MNNRRKFLQQTLATAVITSLAPLSADAKGNESRRKKIRLKEGAVILFQGDSITDAGRDKVNNLPPNPPALGGGYAAHVASRLLFDHPDKQLKIYNRGISGNKVFQLAERWDADCLNIKPDVLSVMVGVNDYWHTLTHDYKGTIKTYKEDYLKLMDRTIKALPDLQLIIAEPYALKGIKSVDDKWYPAFDEYRAAAKEVADQFGALFIPTQQLFNNALKAMPGSYWTGDGVHPSLAGVRIMADTWLELFK